MYVTDAPILLRKINGFFTACRRTGFGLVGSPAGGSFSLLAIALTFAGLLIRPMLLALGLAALVAMPHVALAGAAKWVPLLAIGATQNTQSSAATVANLADLKKKTNTTLKVGIKLVTEEAKWFRPYPKEAVDYSSNETRIPVLLTQPVGVATLPDGGPEAFLSTPNPTHGTVTISQLNKRYGYTGLGKQMDARAAAAAIEKQIPFQTAMALTAFGHMIGLQTYAGSTGALAVVQATGTSGATQTDIPLKNAFNTTHITGVLGSTASKTYMNTILRPGQHVALVRSASLVEFGIVIASPAASAGVGYADITFTSAITPTVGDILYLANSELGATIASTDKDLWPIGFIEMETAAGLHGLTAANWVPAYDVSTAERLSFQVKEAMINAIWNASGTQMNRMIVSQGVRRDAIAGERGARRYDSAETDLEGDLTGFKYMTSQLVPPGYAIGWYDQALSKIELSDQPDDSGEPTSGNANMFSIDKVQGYSQYAASYDYFYAKVCSSRGATAFHYNLGES